MEKTKITKTPSLLEFAKKYKSTTPTALGNLFNWMVTVQEFILELCYTPFSESFEDYDLRQQAIKDFTEELKRCIKDIEHQMNGLGLNFSLTPISNKVLTEPEVEILREITDQIIRDK